MADTGYIGVPTVAPETRVPDSYQHIQPRPSEFGGLIGAGIEHLGKGLEQASTNLFNIEEFRQKIDTDDQVNQFIAYKDRVLHGDPSQPRRDASGNVVMGPDGKPMPDSGFMGMEGREAADRRESLLKDVEERRKQGAANLKSDYARFHFNEQTRRIYATTVSDMGVHTTSQLKNWGVGVNASGADLSMNSYLRNLDNPEEMKHHARDYINFHVQAAEVKFGFDPQIRAAATAKAEQQLLEARVNALAVNNAPLALDILEKKENREIAGTRYDEMHAKVERLNNKQVGDREGAAAIGIGREQGIEYFKSRAGERLGQRAAMLDPRMFDAMLRASLDYEAETGKKAQFESFVRTLPEQAAARWRFEHGLGGTAARPGYSEHEEGKGRAVDLPSGDFLNWVRKNGNKYGFAFLPSHLNDPGHVQLEGVKTGPGVPYTGGATNTIYYEPSVRPAGIVNQGAAALRRFAAQDLLDKYAGGKLNYEQFQIGMTHVNHVITAMRVADDENTKAEKEAHDQAVGEYLGEAHDAGPAKVQELLARAWADPRLEKGRSRYDLTKLIEDMTGVIDRQSNGQGFVEAFKAVTAPYGTEGKITDAGTILRMGSDGVLTPKGTSYLINVLKEMDKPDAAGIHRMTAKAYEYAKDKMVKEQLVPGFGRVTTNLKGQNVFDSQFSYAFEKSFAHWLKEGNNPVEFFEPKNIDKLIDQVYPPRQRAVDSLGDVKPGTAEPEKPGEPLPPAPAGANPVFWKQIVSTPPTDKASGQKMRRADWAELLGKLHSDPEKYVPVFDKKIVPEMQETGFTGEGIVRGLKSESAATPAPAPKEEPKPRFTVGRMWPNMAPTGMVEEGNIDLDKRPVVKNADGTISTVESMSFNDGGKEILIPKISEDGQHLSPEEAIEQYRKTGKNLGKFDTPENATVYARRLHGEQEAQYGTKPGMPGVSDIATGLARRMFPYMYPKEQK